MTAATPWAVATPVMVRLGGADWRGVVVKDDGGDRVEVRLTGAGASAWVARAAVTARSEP